VLTGKTEQMASMAKMEAMDNKDWLVPEVYVIIILSFDFIRLNIQRF
jgi:hypothetical protein